MKDVQDKKRNLLATFSASFPRWHKLSTLLAGYFFQRKLKGCARVALEWTEGKNNEKESTNISLFVRARHRMEVHTLYVCASARWDVRWSTVPQFGQKVNNYSAYSVIMVPVSIAARVEGGRLVDSCSLVMKYRHRGATYTWIFINTSLTVMRPEQVGRDTRTSEWGASARMQRGKRRWSSPRRNTALKRAAAAHPLALTCVSPQAPRTPHPCLFLLHFCSIEGTCLENSVSFEMKWVPHFICGKCVKQLARLQSFKETQNCLFLRNFCSILFFLLQIKMHVNKRLEMNRIRMLRERETHNLQAC